MHRSATLLDLPRRRWLPAVLAVVLAAGLLAVIERQVAAQPAPGPSVPPPQVPSVPVAPQGMRPTEPDQASSRALRGDQPAGSAPKSGAGTSTATSLSPSASWNVSPQTGDFTWSYPLRVPPAPGGLEPGLALSYTSSAVDGRTAVTNNQPSWIGDGWDLNPGFVERTYSGCADDKDGGSAPRTGDLCWRSHNATASYGGGGGMLVRDAATGVWRPKVDDGSRVELDTGAGNGDDNGEYWKITTPDGTQYFYGSRPQAKSTWTVPVFGDDPGEPCHQATFAASHCTQAYRWNLDKVVDAHGNTILYTYETETNAYGMNLKDAAVSYVRGGTLRQIDYGLGNGVATATGRVVFDVADRCVPGSTCTLDRRDNWPDTPLAERCEAATCPDKHSPTFWSTKRLASVTTRVWNGSTYTDVDRWTLDQQFPDPGDGEKAALWLKSITHTGLAGGSIALPPVTFEGTVMPNRVWQADNLSPLLRYRITGIVTEAGGVTSIDYAEPNCVPGSSMPANPETNTLRCFPVRWLPRPTAAERTDWFHKYVVEAVTSSDRISSSMDQKVAYEYLDGAAWHFDTSEFTPEDKKTWNDYRGYGRVVIRGGRSPDPAGPIGKTEKRFYRGMAGDRLPGGGSRGDVVVRDSEGGARADHDWLQGFEFESTVFLGDTAEVVSKAISDPHWQGPTATRGAYKAYLLRPGTQRVITMLEGGARQTTRTETGYDDRGFPTTVNDLGDVATAADDRCIRTTYARNTSAWLLSLPSRVQTVAVNCGATPVYPGHAVSDERKSYDGKAWGEAPTVGDLTKAEVLAERPASGPVYAVAQTARYDAHGRVVESTDALRRVSRTAYTPTLGGPTTRMVVTDPAEFTVTTDLQRAHGQPTRLTDANGNVTETAYDALGRAVQLWQSDRPRELHPSTPSARYSYLMRRDAPNVVTTEKIGPNGGYVTSHVLYDGMLRVRQVQEPAVGGGRLLADTRYDSQGRAFKVAQPYFNDAPVNTSLWEASETEVPSHTATRFDGAGRTVASIVMGGAMELWRTTATYGGDRVRVTPPRGGTATTTVTSARGQTVELHQHHAATPTGPADVTRSTYTPAGLLATLQDPAGNTWRYSYDLRGRQVRAVDPDKGTSTATYDDAGQVTSQTDARDQTLSHSYDVLGRRLSTRSGGPTGPLLARWTFDTARFGKGQLATATSYDGDGNAYTSEVHTYTAHYQPRRTSITIPAAAGALAGTYEFSTAFNPDGSIAGQTFPAVGDPRVTGLFAEEVRHTYDDEGRPETTYGGPDGSTVLYASGTDYTRYGERQRLQLGSGTRRVWLSSYYDANTRRLARAIVDAELPNPMQADLHYTFDPAGNITTIADTPRGRPADVQCFRYDHLRRLTQAWTPPLAAGPDPAASCTPEPSTAALAGPAPYRQSFAYDQTGNRRSHTRHAAAGDTITTATFPAPGAVRPHAPVSITTTSPSGPPVSVAYTYDQAGNTATRGQARLTWDAPGRLAEFTQAGATTRFVYDAGGTRLLRRDPTATTLYLGPQEIRFDHATGALSGTRYYSHGGQVIAARTKAGLSWLAADHHGTAQLAIDTGTLTAVPRRHDPFGNPRGAQPAAWPGERGFVDGTTDASTGLTHLGAREYDPAQGRFISVDPLIDPADPQQLNGYAYANNNPVSFSDPDGLRPICGECEYEGHAWTSNPAKAQAINTKRQTKANNARRAAAAQASRAAQARMRQPVLINGRRIPKIAIDTFRQPLFNYQGSDDFTYADAIEFMAQGQLQFSIVCQALGGGVDECSSDSDGDFLRGLGDLGKFIYDLTPIADVQYCLDGSQSCWQSALNATGPGKVLRLLDRAADGLKSVKAACSFTGDTEVLMADGTTKPIGQLAVGDKVLATDPETGERGAREVTAVIVHQDTVVDLVLEDGSEVSTTADHPFWNQTDRKWQEAGQLDPGDELLDATGRAIPVDGLDRRTARPAAAYNLTVEGLHTYHVLAGTTPVLVHNCGPNITEKGLNHSFDEHAAQWFGREVTKGAKLAEWRGLVERAAGSTKVVPWSSSGRQTNAHLARIDGKYFAAQFDRATGELVTAWIPNQGQLGVMLRVLGEQ